MTFRTLAALVAIIGTLSSAALAAPSVTVRVPRGISSSGTIVDSAPNGQEYVVVENVRVKNPSNTRPQSYLLTDFQLIIGEKRYTPTPRPHLGAIDLSQNGLLSPNEALTTNLSFLVPIESSRSTLEFLPADWYDSYGTRILYCCI